VPICDFSGPATYYAETSGRVRPEPDGQIGVSFGLVRLATLSEKLGIRSMKIIFAMLSMLSWPLLANAGEFGVDGTRQDDGRNDQLHLHTAASSREFISLLQATHHFELEPQHSSRRFGTQEAREYESPLAKAIRSARKKGIVEESVLGYTAVLIACQHEQSPLLTIPFQTADSQQNHCFRF
jgi:hypothetical protein